MQERVTIVMPVSRADTLPLVFTSLETLECDPYSTNLLVIVDGSNELYVDARNRVAESRFNNALCVQSKQPHVPALTFTTRRLRIAALHNELKELVSDCKYVLGIEDDTVIPKDTLKILLEDYAMNPYVGFIEGVELGRHGTPYVGAWKFDDVYEPKKLVSVLREDKKTLQEIDAGGFYCFITRVENYKNHKFEPFESKGMGPDINFGINLRREGYTNLIDWRIKCQHIKDDGTKISMSETLPASIQYDKKGDIWVWNQHV